LRINSAADDAAGLAIREMMRADITTMNQGIRNTADAISMIQTADGALGVIDEKLVRMKELAEQAATGTYTTAQREIINSEYQAMAREIDRIANATNFNGLKLLDGSVTNQHGGRGLKIHFGVSNNAAEDYYFVNIGDSRATSSTGLRIGGDAKNDIWGQGAAGAGPLAGPGCCTAGYDSLDGRAGFVSGETFSYGYNWDWKEDDDAGLLSGKYLAGRYAVEAGDSLQDLVNKVNAGTQSRVGVKMDAALLQEKVMCGGTVGVCIGDEAYYWGATSAALGSEFMTSAYQYAFASDGVVGRNGYWASGALAALIKNGQRLTAETTAQGSRSSADSQGAASLQSAVAAVFKSRMLISQDASAGALVDAAFFKSLGIDTLNPLASATFGTGIYADAGGEWTSSASLAAVLGFKEITFTVGPESRTVQYKAGDFANHAWFSTSSFGAVSAGSGVSVNSSAAAPSGIWVSGTVWTNSASIAAALGMSSVTFEVVGMTTTADAAATANLAALYRQVFASGVATTGPVGTGIFINSATGLWTTDASVAKALGAAELEVTLSANVAVSAAASSVMGTLSDSVIDTLTTSWKMGATGALEADIYFDAATDKWTTSAKIAKQYNKEKGGAMTLTKLQINVQNQGNYDDFREGVRAALAGAGWTGATGNAASRVTQIGQGWSDAVTKAAAGTLLAKGTKKVAGLGSTYTDMADSFAKSLASRGLDPQTRVVAYAPRDLASLETAVKAKLTGVKQIDARGVTAADLAALNVAGKTKTKELDPVLTKKGGAIDSGKRSRKVGDASTASAGFTAAALAEAINKNADSMFWAMTQPFDSLGRKADMVYIFTKAGGNFNDILACDVAAVDQMSREGLAAVSFENAGSGIINQSGTTLALGGENWGTMKPVQSREKFGNEFWNLTLNGRDVGKERDLWIANAGEVTTPGLTDGIINGMDRNSFVEIQNADDGGWRGAEVRTQSAAQEALDAISVAIDKKDKIRADLGALQNRLENTMTNLTVQSENLQASESRISDVDVATEMTEFTRNNVLTQAATSMLAQANSLSQLALSLIR
jgi:flagellin-like hook-associated protein FlgL